MDTYILIANTSATAGQAAVTLYFEDDTSVTKTFQLMPNSRTTVGVAFHPEFAKAFTQRFGAIVEALPLTAGGAVPQIVVERAMYSADVGRAFSSGWQPGRPYWPAGTDSVATRIQ